MFIDLARRGLLIAYVQDLIIKGISLDYLIKIKENM